MRARHAAFNLSPGQLTNSWRGKPDGAVATVLVRISSHRTRVHTGAPGARTLVGSRALSCRRAAKLCRLREPLDAPRRLGSRWVVGRLSKRARQRRRALIRLRVPYIVGRVCFVPLRSARYVPRQPPSMPTSTSDSNVNSLSARQVDLLLRTVRAHHAHLSTAHEDARRDRPPGYLIDFDLLYRYMFDYDSYPDWSQELEYLLARSDTTYLVGPGTRIEIDKLMRRLRHDSPDMRRPADPAVAEEGLARLDALMGLPNLESNSPPDIDRPSFDLVKAALDRSRPRGTRGANRADALNWAAVMYLRQHADELGLAYFPYLLTGTIPLLNEAALDPRTSVAVSRNPADAIYSHVVRQVFPDASSALKHTIHMAFVLARAEHTLCTSEAYLTPKAFQREPDWERTISEDRVGEDLRAQLGQLAGFVHDPVVYEAQRVYDNAHLAATSLAQQRRPIARDTSEKPRKLFDLIAAITAALAASDHVTGGLKSLWDAVLQVRETKHAEFHTYELIDRDSTLPDSPYMTVEIHNKSDDHHLMVMRWPTSLDPTRVVEIFSQSFARHALDHVDLIIGTPEREFYFDAAMPLTLAELTAGMEEVNADDASHCSPEIAWIRLNSPAFDLYADVTPRPPRDARIGVFATEVDPLHVTDLYGGTSARYLFSTWITEALTHILTASSVPTTRVSLS